MKTQILKEIETLVVELNKPRIESTKEYLITVRDEVRAMYGVNMDKILLDAGFESKDFRRVNSSAMQYKKSLIEKYGVEKYNLGTTLFHRDIDVLVNKEYKAKEAKLIVQIGKKILDDDVLVNIETHVGSNGYLNGDIKLKGATININTIVAYGMIQRPHYRTLVKRK